jgi:choline dehydrogenase
MSGADPIPREADLIVAGGGTAGAVVAGRLAEGTGARVVLLEAGPDYGSADGGRWPADLRDAATLAMVSHDWGYAGEIHGRMGAFNRAKVIGGCSSHNGGAAVKGSRLDYDGWAEAGNSGWATDELLPLFDSAWQRMCVRGVGLDDLTPFQAACTDAATAIGIPVVEDFNDLDEDLGVAPFPINIDAEGRRINTAFAYLDPVRDRPNLTVVGDARVERLTLGGSSVQGVVIRAAGGEVEVRAPRVVLSAGAYGSPAIMLRSGIGDSRRLAAAGVEPRHELAGVGENLHDQPTVEVDYTGSDELRRLMTDFARDRWRPDEQVIAKYPSEGCRRGFDMHIFPMGGRNPLDRDAWRWTLGAACLSPVSRGHVRLTGPSADDRLTIDHRFLSDPEGRDLTRLVEAVGRIREMAADPRLGPLLGDEVFPGPGTTDPDALTRAIGSASVHYWHPVGSCKMGPADDPGAVVDATGAVHGLDGLFVADASVMPAVISGNTMMPTAVIGERMARALAARL